MLSRVGEDRTGLHLCPMKGSLRLLMVTTIYRQTCLLQAMGMNKCLLLHLFQVSNNSTSNNNSSNRNNSNNNNSIMGDTMRSNIISNSTRSSNNSNSNSYLRSMNQPHSKIRLSKETLWIYLPLIRITSLLD